MPKIEEEESFDRIYEHEDELEKFQDWRTLAAEEERKRYDSDDEEHEKREPWYSNSDEEEFYEEDVDFLKYHKRFKRNMTDVLTELLS